jgi:hypothetical protein
LAYRINATIRIIVFIGAVGELICTKYCCVISPFCPPAAATSPEFGGGQEGVVGNTAIKYALASNTSIEKAALTCETAAQHPPDTYPDRYHCSWIAAHLPGL